MKRKETREQRKLVVTFCCNEREFRAIKDKVGETTCRSLSEYARKVLLNKPVTVIHRNASIDSLIDVVNEVRRDIDNSWVVRGSMPEIETEKARQIKKLVDVFHQIASLCTSNGM